MTMFFMSPLSRAAVGIKRRVGLLPNKGERGREKGGEEKSECKLMSNATLHRDNRSRMSGMRKGTVTSNYQLKRQPVPHLARQITG